MYTPDCDNCVHLYECSLRKELKEAREFIFNINREMSGRKDFILNGKYVPADKEGE